MKIQLNAAARLKAAEPKKTPTEKAAEKKPAKKVATTKK